MKIAYVHNLPLEYYPPASNFLDLLSRLAGTEVRVYSTRNRKGRKPYSNAAIGILRTASPDPGSAAPWRLLVALWWHVCTAVSLSRFRPDAVFYVEPHSAFAVYLYLRFLRGSAKLFVHHHEYYERGDYLRPGMRLPQLGSRLEHSYLFRRADWISQTNSDRLRLAQQDHPEVAGEIWHILPNYPPAEWIGRIPQQRTRAPGEPLRLIYVGSASFEDTYIREIVDWVARFPGEVVLHICGYNVAPDVWNWLADEPFENVSCDAHGYDYEDLPGTLAGFDVGLVLYKGNTKNFVYNIPNKVYEYILCGLQVWYPSEMLGMRELAIQFPDRVRELSFSELDEFAPVQFERTGRAAKVPCPFTSERACAPVFERFGVD